MMTFPNVSLARTEDAAAISALRQKGYSTSKEFDLADPGLVGWNSEDESAIVLAAWVSPTECVGTMRGRLVKSRQALADTVKVYSELMVPALPALFLDLAATDPKYRGAGLNSVLRYHFLRLARDLRVKTIVGWVYEGASRTRTMTRLGYKLWPTSLLGRFVDEAPHLANERRSLIFATLAGAQLDSALLYLEKTCAKVLAEYPWRGEDRI